MSCFVKKYLLIGFLVLCYVTTSLAQEQDAERCKDSNYFKRLPNTFITDCVTDTNEMEFIIAPDSIARAEGVKTFIAYGYNSAKARVAPTFAQIVKVYETEVAKRKGRKMYYSNDAGNATLFFKSNGKDVWVILDDGSGDGEGYYSLSILEPFELPEK